MKIYFSQKEKINKNNNLYFIHVYKPSTLKSRLKEREKKSFEFCFRQWRTHYYYLSATLFLTSYHRDPTSLPRLFFSLTYPARSTRPTMSFDFPRISGAVRIDYWIINVTMTSSRFVIKWFTTSYDLLRNLRVSSIDSL